MAAITSKPAAYIHKFSLVATFAPMKNKSGLLLLHITGCIAFLSLPVLLSPDVAWDMKFIRLAPFQEDFITYTILLLFFYLNYFFLIPRLYFEKKYVVFFLCILAGYALIEFLPHLVLPGNHTPKFHGPPPGMGGGRNPFPPPDGNFGPGPGPRRGIAFLSRIPHFEYLFQYLIVVIISALIRINNRLKQTEKEKINAELSYLRAQINPHFLFNTLNSIYSLAIEENADHTATAVVKLSGMMRYVISEAHNDYVSLDKEISYITDYIELQRIRLGNTVNIRYQASGSTAGKQIAPLVLISFIENAFKHGVNPEQPSEIGIDIAIEKSILHMQVINSKVKTINGHGGGSNIGIKNTTNRLQLLYASKHELTVKEDEKEFLVVLKIDLQ